MFIQCVFFNKHKHNTTINFLYEKQNLSYNIKSIFSQLRFNNNAPYFIKAKKNFLSDIYQYFYFCCYAQSMPQTRGQHSQHVMSSWRILCESEVNRQIELRRTQLHAVGVQQGRCDVTSLLVKISNNIVHFCLRFSCNPRAIP